jgi:hypothetical protein
VFRLDSIGPRALDLGLTNTVCGPVRAVTPPKRGLVAKPKGTFLSHKLSMIGRHSLMMDVADDGMPRLHHPPTWEELSTK